MRKFSALILSILFFTSIFAYTPQRDTVFEGASARAYYSNASMVRMYANTSIPAFIRFDDPNMTILEAQALITKLGGLESHFGFEFIRDERDELGFIHSKYQQTYDGIPFYDGVYVFHTKNGKVYSMNGKCYDAPVNGAIGLSEQDALNKAKAFMGAKSYKWEIPEEEEHFKHEQEDSSVTYFPKTMKYIIPTEGDFYRMNPELELCYAFDIYAHEPLDKKRVFVNAKTGAIAFYDQLLQHATVTGTANTAYSGTQTIKTDSTGPVNYRLRETGRGLGVETFNLLKGTNYGAAVDFTDSNNIWNNVNANQDQYATDAHWGCEMTYDYFFLKHGRNSINNAGFKLMSYIHYSTNYTNAFWDGSRMTYGDGAAPYTPLVAMDIAGHEVTHGLTSNTSNLTYSYESGALNESFSDIFGVSIDFYSRPSQANYLMGDGIGGSPFRNMANPNAHNHPDCYNGAFWYVGTADNGGVHWNSGVQNYWYYLMVNGGSGTNDIGNAFSVQRLGLDTAGKIAFRNNTVYLTPSSQYADARFYAILSATDLYGCGSYAVKQTTNAWHAVGVGAKWDSTILVNFTANPTSNCVAPSVHAFTNLSSNGTYQWYFGDGNTSGLKNPSNTYAALGSYSVKLIATCGLKKDSLTKTNYIVLSGPVPVSFTKIKDTVICEKSSIQLFANSSLGPVKWEFQNVIDSVVTVAPLMTSIYRISKANTCQTFYDSIIVTVIRTPKVTGTASALSSCLGAVDTLKGSCTMRSSTILQLGTSTTTTNTNGNTPYNRTWEGSRTQYLIRASELTGIGASAGPIKSLQFNVTNAGSGANHQKNFTIKMGHTSNTNITGAFANIVGNFNTVYGPLTQGLPTVGWNTFSFPAPFNWDGVSNIVIEICHDNDLNNTCGTCKSPNATVQYSTLAFNTTYSNFSDNTQRCGTTGGSTSGYTTTRRPNFKFDFYIPQPATASATWLWTPGNMTTANATVIPPTMPTSSYKVVATNAGTSCKDSATVNINVVTPLTITARTDSTICSGSPIRLTATASSGTITWNPGGLVGPSVTVNPLVTTIYIAQVTNACGTARDTVRVTVIPLPTLLARTDSSICATKSINLTASSNITPITWTPGSLTGSPVLVSPAATTAYIAQVSNACGIRRDTVNVAVTPLPTLTARLDSTICAGNSFNLTATSNISPITWNPGALTGGSVFVSPLTSTSYIAQSMDACGIARDTVNVTVIPIPTLTARADSSICAGATINLTANSNITPITWNPGAMSGASVPVNPSTTTQYYAQVSNACGVKRDTVNVAVILIPSLNARPDSTICSGNSFNLTATANISPIAWNPGALTGGSVFVSPTSTTAYVAQVSNMCGTSMDTVNVTVIPTPILTARADTGICNGQSVFLTATSNISPITWNPGALVGSAVSVSPSSSTMYTVQVSNACGVKNDTVNIGVTIVPSLSARADSTICNGNSINLTATANISPITWNPGALTGGSVFVSPSITTTYIAQVSNVCGIAKDTVNINVILVPSLTARNDTGICNGQSVWLTATSNISPITWNPGSLNGAAVNVNPTTTTQYIAQVSNACGIKNDTVNIAVTNVPTINARADSSICAGQSIMLTATSNVSPITWNPGGLIGSSVSVSPAVTTNYIAQSSNACGTKVDTVLIAVIPQPSIIARPDTSFCNGFPIILHANANLPITWNPGNVVGNYLAFYPTSNTQYIGTVQNVCGIKRDTVNATVLNKPTLTARLDSTICAGNSILLSANSTSSILWNPGNMTGPSVSVSPLVNASYIAQSTNACGTSKDTVNITVIPKPYVMASVDDSFCIGSGIQISATSFLPITWNPGSLSGSPVTVNPSTNTQYIAQVSNACGIAKDTVNIKVVQQPTINAIADTIACPNNSIQMTASSNANILWTPGNIAGPVYNVVASANALYVATASNLCGAKKDTVNITVLPIPSLTARADTSICAGQNVRIFANSNINAAIWNPGNINAISFNANPSITTQYIGTSSNKCGIAKDTVVITVNPLASVIAMNDTSVCLGDSIELRAIGVGNMVWSNGALGNKTKVKPIVVTNYSVTSSNNCNSATDFVKISVLDRVKASATYIKSGNKFTFTNTSLFANSRLWLFGDGKSDTSKNPIHTYTNKGNYTAKLISKNTCGNDTFVMANLTVTSGVSNLIALATIKVFPNPANDVFLIQSEGAEIDVNAISITDALGRSIQLPIEKKNNEFICNSSQLASGLYQIKVSLGENYTTLKLLIEH